MDLFVQGLLSVFGTLASYAVFSLARFLYEQLTSPLRDMVGPNNHSLFFGHSKELHTRELYTEDTKALNHIAVHSNLYQKPPFVRSSRTRAASTRAPRVAVQDATFLSPGRAHEARRADMRWRADDSTEDRPSAIPSLFALLDMLLLLLSSLAPLLRSLFSLPAFFGHLNAHEHLSPLRHIGITCTSRF
ncbi:hypothetical protein C8R44DRAFT_867428 [Mycena epipterygia]|nr:hypothetical protein C8R44DRAFT_867428 [Mycena epipterygia]